MWNLSKPIANVFWHSCWSRLVKMLFWHSCRSRLVKMLFWHSCWGRLVEMIFWHSNWLSKTNNGWNIPNFEGRKLQEWCQYSFLICFPMKYWDFQGKSKSILPLGWPATKEDTIFLSLTVYKNRLFKNSRLTCTFLSKRGWNVGYLSEITPMTLTFRRRTADVTFCTDVKLFLHATSGRLPLMIAAMIVCSPTFCALIVWNGIWTIFCV